MAENQSPYVKDEQGATFIAASQRPDGTWRKPRRVREGYVPQEEVPLYESKGKQFTKSKPQYPVGLSPEIINESKARREKAEKSLIPGLIINADGKSSKKKKKKKNASSPVEAVTDNLSKTHLAAEAGSSPKSSSCSNTIEPTAITPHSPEESKTNVGSPADPAKRIKNLRKRLREIELIEQKMSSGELKTLEKDQIEKVARKKEVLREIEQLSKELGE
ncbi:partner of Y14 and mago [Bacillus rossius redtenbacheri]|uniref:partner of Y14 and mago n=1 Tax=Bacillus rossius redtenbacheri TaxID=93214 RepID=UPI002FDCCA49